MGHGTKTTEEAETTKFFGFQIDSNFKWKIN
jgi:hypothetical protein